MTRSVTLICGPPCSGKTTLAEQLAGPTDLVLDLDRIAIRLGSPTRWRHQPGVITHAEEIFRAALAQLARTDTGTAYVVRCAANPAVRGLLAHRIRADRVIVLLPPMRRCLARAKADRRPPGTLTVIRDWYRQYRPHPRDITCPPAPLPRAPTPVAGDSAGLAPTIPPGSGTGRTAQPPRNASTTGGGNA